MPVISIIPKKVPGVETNRVTADYIHSSLVINGGQQTIPSGSAVYVQTSDCGCHCEVYPANSSSVNTSDVIGVTTSAIFVGKHSRIAVAGSVSYILEDGVDPPDNGDILYLSTTQDGAVTPVFPDFLNNSVVVIGRAITGKVILDITQAAIAGAGAGAGAPVGPPPGDI